MNLATWANEDSFKIMLKILHKYLASTFILPFLGSLGFFVLFLLTSQLFRIMGFAVQKNVEWAVIFELMGHICMSFLAISLPLAGLFAMIYAMGKLSDDAEIIAMRSFGLSKYKLFAPFFFLSIAIGFFAYLLSSDVIPYSQDRFKNQVVRMTSKGALSEIKPGEFFTEIPSLTLFAEKVKNDGELLEDVFIYDKGQEQNRIISAKKADFIIQNKDDLTKEIKLKFKFYDGNLFQYKHNEVNFQKVNFETYEMPINGKNFEIGSVSKDSMLSSKELRKKITWNEKKVASKNAKRDDHVTLAKSKIELLSRYNTPIQFLIFILVGFSLGIKSMRGNKNNSSYYGIIFLLAHYFLFLGGVSAAKKLTIPVEAAIFGPTLISFLFGAMLFRKMDWVS